MEKGVKRDNLGWDKGLGLALDRFHMELFLFTHLLCVFASSTLEFIM